MKKLLPVLVLLLTLTSCALPGIPDHPPALSVTLAEGSHTTGTGSYYWDYRSDLWGGTTGVIADGIHPLDGKDTVPHLETAGTTAALSFNIRPDQLSAECWSDVHWGNTETASSLVALNGNQLPLRYGGYIYRIHASWDRSGYEGSAEYILYITSTGEDAVLDAPPALIAESGGKSIEAVQSTYGWNYRIGENQMQSVCADSSGPEELLKDTEPLKTDASAVNLHFAVAPDRVEVTPGNLSGEILTLEEGKTVYTLHAYWNNRKDYEGDAIYGLYIEKVS
ncbi:MAG: hypothetical protein IJ043_05065 [Clostridia bacterium]|nr:hypothetical protein [Clostridia bacterium]